MPLSLDREFTVGDIAAVDVFKGGVVYCLRGKLNEEIIIKSENISQSAGKHFDLSKKAMGVVDRNVKASKKMSGSELMALRVFVQQKKTVALMMGGSPVPGACSDLDQAMAKLDDPSLRNIWYKMPRLDMVDLTGALEKHFGLPQGDTAEHGPRLKQSSKLLREFLKTLRASGGLEALGKVIAIDAFSGNTDRFVPGAGKGMVFGALSFKFKALWNPGNLMIAGEGNAKTISGMDFADPFSPLKQADLAYNKQIDGNRANVWYGEDIVDPARRKAFAKDIISDLEVVLELAPKKSIRDKLPGGPLGFGALRRLEAGMVAGARLLAKAMRAKINAQSTSFGVTQGKKLPQSFIYRVGEYEKI